MPVVRPRRSITPAKSEIDLRQAVVATISNPIGKMLAPGQHAFDLLASCPEKAVAHGEPECAIRFDQQRTKILRTGAAIARHVIDMAISPPVQAAVPRADPHRLVFVRHEEPNRLSLFRLRQRHCFKLIVLTAKNEALVGSSPNVAGAIFREGAEENASVVRRHGILLIVAKANETALRCGQPHVAGMIT